MLQKLLDLFRRFVKKPIGNALLFWVVLLAALLLLTDFLVMPLIAGQFSRRIEVPSVVGLPIAEAESLIQKKGLSVRWAKEGRYSSEIPAGSVLLQIPAPERVVKRGRTIFLTVSKGVREVEVPELRGRSRRQAEISLQRLGLFEGREILGAHASIPIGVIIRTVPESGKMVRVGDTVQLVISSGERTHKEILPNLVDLSLQQAEEVLQEKGFVLGEVVKDSSQKLPNTVLSQYPLAGEYLPLGDTVRLTVVQ